MKKNKQMIIVGSCVLTIVIAIMCGMCFDSEFNVKHRLQWWLSEINWDENRSGYTGKNVKIAILDTGIYTDHVDFDENIQDDIRIDSLGKSETNDKSHGTAVAGIISAYPSHEKGALGIATDATIISIDITDEETIEYQNLIKGIEIAMEQEVDIISISIGIKTDYPELHDCIKKAYEKGIIIVASAGNYMTDDILYPAKYEEVIAVGSLNKSGEKISPVGNLSKPVVYLPGENIVTTASLQKEYVGATGTSFSTAILTGIIAVVMEANPNLQASDVYSYFDTEKIGLDVEQCINDLKGE